jgi:exosortase family protein XrtM
MSGRSAILSPTGLGLRAAGFLVLFAVLQLGWQTLRGSALERAVIHDGTVRPAAFLVNLLTPTTGASAVDFTLRAPGGGLNIQNGCEGLEALFLLSAALLVAPIPWRSRGRGLLLGCAVVFIINQARILVLFYAYRADHSLFDPLHATVTPIVVILLVCAYFYAWLLYSNRSMAAAA